MRRAATETLGGLGGEASRALLARMAGAESSTHVRAAAIVALAPLDSGAALSAATSFLKRAEDEAAITEIFTAFLQRQRGAKALAKVLGPDLPDARAAEIGLRILNASGRREESLEFRRYRRRLPSQALQLTLPTRRPPLTEQLIRMARARLFTSSTAPRPLTVRKPLTKSSLAVPRKASRQTLAG